VPTPRPSTTEPVPLIKPPSIKNSTHCALRTPTSLAADYDSSTMNCPAMIHNGGGTKIILTAALFITLYSAIYAKTNTDFNDYTKIPFNSGRALLITTRWLSKNRGLSCKTLYTRPRHERHNDQSKDRNQHNLTYCEKQDMQGQHWKKPNKAQVPTSGEIGPDRNHVYKLAFDSTRPNDTKIYPIKANSDKDNFSQSDERLLPRSQTQHHRPGPLPQPPPDNCQQQLPEKTDPT